MAIEKSDVKQGLIKDLLFCSFCLVFFCYLVVLINKKNIQKPKPTGNMQYGIIFLTLIFSVTIKLVGSMTFNGKTPPNSYIIPVGVGDVIVATASWTSTATDLDLHLFQPGKIITDSNSDDCECDCCGSTETATVTANANGNVIAWAQQWSGAGVQYTITIKRNGVVVAG